MACRAWLCGLLLSGAVGSAHAASTAVETSTQGSHAVTAAPQQGGEPAGDPTSAVETTKPGVPQSAARKPPPQAASERDLPVVRGPDALGPISVGHAHAGYLFNGVRMPKSKEWNLSVPQHVWGTAETVRSLMKCIRKVYNEFPGTPAVFLGSLSAKGGGALPPHKSHRTGRDVDIYLYRKPGTTWYKPATAEDLDRPRTWALMKTILTETQVDFILLDKKVKGWLEDYAHGLGEDAQWLEYVFHGVGRYKNPMVKHVPGHVAHMHVRFVSPIARERGRRAYDRLVAQGHIKLASKQLVHTVESGDTLSEIAEQYSSSVEAIMKLNGLESSKIYVGKELKLSEQIDLRGARDRIVVPRWPQPPAHPRARESVAPSVGSRTVRHEGAPESD